MAKAATRRRTPITAEEHLGRVLATGPAAGRYQWPHLLAITHAVTANRSAERERLLRRAALYRGRLRLNPSHGLPHAMPAEDMLRCLAVQALGRWDRRRHRDVIQHVIDTAEREMVREIARAALRG